MRETVLDWKPFDYYTVEQDSGPMGTVRVTFRLRETDGGRGTQLHAALIGRLGRLPGFLARPLIRFVYTRVFNYASVALKLADILDHLPSDDVSVQPPASSS